MAYDKEMLAEQYNTTYQLLTGNEVAFYYRFHEHAWELLIKKTIEWDNNDTDFDFDE
ncbi:hypothetical protein JHK87_042836 [Glycine soja]|nr:hypothetical protein JHK87_042836 [Glycine soja]